MSKCVGRSGIVVHLPINPELSNLPKPGGLSFLASKCSIVSSRFGGSDAIEMSSSSDDEFEEERDGALGEEEEIKRSQKHQEKRKDALVPYYFDFVELVIL